MALKTALPAKKSDKSEVLLQLALYKRYNRMGTIYEHNVTYKFTPEQAMVLLDESDNGKRIWKRYHPNTATKRVVVQVEAKDRVVDMSATSIAPTIPSDDPTEVKKVIEIGNDEEIQDILTQQEEDEPVGEASIV